MTLGRQALEEQPRRLSCSHRLVQLTAKQVAITAGIDYGFATFFSVFLNSTLGLSLQRAVHAGYAGILILHGVLNTFGVLIVAFLSDVSVWWHVLGVMTIAIVLFFVPSHHASATFIFTKFENQSTLGVPILYVFMVGLLSGAVHHGL